MMQTAAIDTAMRLMAAGISEDRGTATGEVSTAPISNIQAVRMSHKTVRVSGARSVIAIVDDEDSVRKAMGRVLQAAGFSTRAYASGAEFLASWHFDRPDCLILDLQMPGLSGTEVQQSLSTAGARFPIVIITAHDSPNLREECMRAGAIAYLCKPLDIRALVAAVSRVAPLAD
jgi:FixJ family two-component response regulator